LRQGNFPGDGQTDPQPVVTNCFLAAVPSDVSSKAFLPIATVASGHPRSAQYERARKSKFLSFYKDLAEASSLACVRLL